METDENIYDETNDNVQMQEIEEHARHGLPDPEIPDIQEPEELGPQERRFYVYSATRVICLALILVNVALDWAVYAELKDEDGCPTCQLRMVECKDVFLSASVFGLLLSLLQIGNIIYQLRVNFNPLYKYEEPLNYIDGRTEVLYQLLLSEIPQLIVLRFYDEECENAKCSDTLTPETSVRVACAVIGMLSCVFRFNFSLPISTYGRRRVKNEFEVFKLSKDSKLLKTIIFIDKTLPRVLSYFGFGFLCCWRRCKIPCIVGTCICDHLTPIWKWAYCVLECWVCRFTFCPKRERGEVWLVNRARALRRRPGCLCFNKEDPFWLGDYATYALTVGMGLVMWYLELHNCLFKGVGPSKILELIMKKSTPTPSSPTPSYDPY